jgi:uncharacterized protein (TIGR02145 family)
LYNWYAVADSRNLCPVGWHVPSNAEWTTLEDFLGGASVAGGKLKSTSALWSAPNTEATNESGFSGLPGGYRNTYGSYYYVGDMCNWWSSTEFTTSASFQYLGYGNSGSYRLNYPKLFGFSVRCIKD